MKKLRSPDEQVGTQDVFDRIQDARMPDQLVGPFEHHMRLVAIRRLHDQAVIEFERLDFSRQASASASDITRTGKW